jgi:uncharacterized protein YraI
MNVSSIAKAVGLAGAVLALSAGTAFAAIATASVNVRTGPSTSYGVIDTLRPGEFVSVTGRSGGWCEVDKSGPNGWVSCAYLADAGMGFYRFRAEPSVSLSFGVRSHRPAMHWPGYWYGPGWYGGPSSSFSLSLSN